MRVEDWLGKDNKIGLDIWHKKYQHGNETFDEWLDRVSGGDAELRELIKSKKFLFGGRVLANRGVPDSGNFYNCFSAGYVKVLCIHYGCIKRGWYYIQIPRRSRYLNVKTSSERNKDW